ncbi:MAG: NAD-binding protein [Anaerolineae bacterium]|nr:NAD-binding protein [Anaerolineae bacterium]
MDSLKENQRQIRLALIALTFILSTGIIGFMVIEKMNLLDAVWLTVITLATIGYGDIYARSPEGRLFTVFLILFGIGAVAYGLQATATFLVSPAIRDIRQRRRAQKAIDRLHQHYIICGAGQIVDNTIHLLLEGARRRQTARREQLYHPVDVFLDRFLGDDAHGHYPRLRAMLRRIFMVYVWLFHRTETLLDVIVIITPDHAFADHLRENDLLVVEGDPTSDDIMRRAGIENAHAMMVMLDSDTEALLTILTARNLNPEIDITAGALEEEHATKMIRVGANSVLAPYEVAGRFMNNATFRPAVSEFFNSILFNQNVDIQATQLFLWDDSPWIGRSLGELMLRENFHAGIIGLRRDSGDYIYAPNDNYRLRENEVLIAVAPGHSIAPLQSSCRGSTVSKPRIPNWQRLPIAMTPPRTAHRACTLEEAEAVASEMSSHYVICGTGRIARSAISKLDPSRPFVIISDNESYTAELLEIGFRVIHGSPVQESVLRKAGVERALAIMVTLDDDASSILTVLNCRSLSKRLLITAAAQTDDMLPKLLRAGADRVVSPFQVAANFVLLATTRPVVSDFLQYVVYNYGARIETTELYMQEDSPWIGSTLASLQLDSQYQAGVIGIHLANGFYNYAPPADHVLQPHEILIVVTPMRCADELRTLAHGSATRRPATLRRSFLETKPLS